MLTKEDAERSLKETKEHLGEQLTYFRRELHLSIHELSRMSGLKDHYIDNMEIGSTDTNLKTLSTLTTCLGKKIRIEITD